MDLRKLDALVAEKVMGWKVRSETVPTYPKGMPMCSIKTLWFVTRPDGTEWGCTDDLDKTDLPRYSSSIEAAWQVRAQMYNVGFWCIVTYNERGVTVAFDHEDGRGGQYTLKDVAQEPLATVMAALEAEGVEVPEE